MRQSTKLIVNTLVTYGRMLVTVGMGLLFTRLMVQGLGKETFGLWAGLSAAVAVALMLSDGVNNAGDRFLAYEVGRGDPARIRATFRTLLAIFVTIAALAAGAAALLEPFVLRTVQWPVDRLAIGRTAYWLTVGFTLFQIVNGPFRSMLVARQSIVALSALEGYDAAARLVLVGLGLLLPGEKVVWACWGLLAQMGTSMLASAVLCIRLAPEARPGLAGVSLARVGELAHYTTWAIVSTISYRVRITGPQLLITNFFGPLAQGSYALAAQLAGYQLSLGAVVSRITQPALVAAEGRGDRARAIQLVHLVNKYSTLLILCYLVPLQLEAPALLHLWVGQDGAGAETLVRLVMVVTALSWTFNGYWIAAGAVNRVAKPVLISLVCDVLAVAGAWAAVRWLAAPVWVIPACSVAGMAAFGAGTTLVTSRALNLPARAWLTECWWPVLKAGAPAAVAAAAWLAVLEPGPVRILLVGFTFTLVLFPLVWLLAMGAEERSHFERVFAGVASRLPRGARRAGGSASAATGAGLPSLDGQANTIDPAAEPAEHGAARRP